MLMNTVINWTAWTLTVFASAFAATAFFIAIIPSMYIPSYNTLIWLGFQDYTSTLVALTLSVVPATVAAQIVLKELRVPVNRCRPNWKPPVTVTTSPAKRKTVTRKTAS